MLKIVHIGAAGRAAPCVFCDWCGQEIQSAAEGNYQWVLTEQGRDELVGESEIYFTHKWCCADFDDHHKERGRWMGAEELDILPIYLIGNLAIKLKEAEVRARYMSSL